MNSFKRKGIISPDLLAALVLVLVSFLVYANTLQGDFVWDDTALFVEHRDIWRWNNLKQLLTTQDNLFGDRYTGYYRPLPNVTFLLDRYIWGDEPPGFHLTNIIFHVLCTITVFFLIKKLSRSRYLGFAGALIFAVHPVHTEVVSWINGRNNVVSALFYLLSFYYYTHYRSNGKVSALVLSLVWFACSLFSKEYALTLPIIVLLYEYSYHSASLTSGRPIRKCALLSIPYFLIIIGYLLIRSMVLPMHGTKSLHLETLWIRIMTVPKTVLIYLKLLLFPFNLSVSRHVSPVEHLLQPEFIFQTVTMAGVIFLWTWSFRKSRTVFFSTGWILVTLLPVLNIIPLSDATDIFLAERYLYLPSAGFCMLCAWCVMQLSHIRAASTLSIGRYATAAILLVGIEVYAFQTVRRNLVWKNELTLWQDTVKKSPNNALAHINLAIHLEHAGRLGEALDEVNMAIRLDPEEATHHFVLGQILYEKGLLEKSLDAVNKAIALDRGHLDAFNLKGNIYYRMGRYHQALSCYESVVRLSSSHAHAQCNLGLTLYQLGRLDEALSRFKACIQAGPAVFEPYYYSASIYEARGAYEKARHFYTESLQHTQDPAKRRAAQAKMMKLDRR
jgi:tetratricopeptide (TPR) repeat protein